MSNKNSKVLAIADKVGYWKCWDDMEKLGGRYLDNLELHYCQARNAEVVAVDNKTSLFPGDTTKLYLRLWNEAGTLDGQADWSGFSSDKLCVVAELADARDLKSRG